MTDIPKKPDLTWVLSRRLRTVDSWLEENHISSPEELDQVLNSLSGEYSWTDRWRREVQLLLIERMISLPISIGSQSSAPVEPQPPPLVVEEVVAPPPRKRVRKTSPEPTTLGEGVQRTPGDLSPEEEPSPPETSLPSQP